MTKNKQLSNSQVVLWLWMGVTLQCIHIHAFAPLLSSTNSDSILRSSRSPSSTLQLSARRRSSSASSYSSSSNNNNNNKNKKYIRIQPRTVRGNRRIFEVQTAVATFTKTTNNYAKVEPTTDDANIAIPGSQSEINTIDLHAMLHFGDDTYFQYYNDGQVFGPNKYNQVFYELILSKDMLQRQSDGTSILPPSSSTGTNSIYPNPIAPPPADEATANSYDLSCQINVVDYTKSNWIHCDVTREEFQQMKLARENKRRNSEGNTNHNHNTNTSDALWVLASTATTPIQEYTSALLRPTTPSTATTNTSSSSSSPSRLFSNLFLPGNSLTTLFRLLLWTFSPSPEIPILLLDWSSLIDPKPTGMISSIFIPVMESLLSGNIGEARRLVFAQMIVSGQTGGGKDEVLVKERNDVVMNILNDYFSKQQQQQQQEQMGQTKQSSALLYGAMHCQDLQSRLEKMGYTLTKTEWRTAWTMSVPSFGTGSSSSSSASRSSSSSNTANFVGNMMDADFASTTNPNDLAISLVIVPLYLLVGGLDWLATVKDIAFALDGGLWGDFVAVAVFYLMRHVALYLGLVKFVVEWDGEQTLFGTESNRD